MYISPILGSQHLLSFQLRDCKVSISLSHPATNHSRWAILGDFTGLPQNFPGPSLGNLCYSVAPDFFITSEPARNQPGPSPISQPRLHHWPVASGFPHASQPVQRLPQSLQVLSLEGWRSASNGNLQQKGDRKTGNVWSMNMYEYVIYVATCRIDLNRCHSGHRVKLG